jgi:hypothetical protein
VSTRKKRKKRVRLTRASERHHFGGSDEARFRVAARASSTLGIAFLMVGVGLPYLMPAWNRTLGVPGNVALRVAGVSLIIVSLMFGKLGKGK